MKVNVLWLGLFLVSSVLVWAVLQGYFVYEAFTSSPVKEGFLVSSETDIQISGCPKNTSQYINNQGNTICCDGKLIDGKCSGQEVCSLSEGSGLPTCSTYRAAWLNEKGAKKCPRRLPNYFEGTNGVGGCTSGSRNTEGTDALNPSDPKCMLYTDADSEIKKKDSCFNQKHFEETSCFSTNTAEAGKEMYETGNGPTIILCSYRTAGSPFPQVCYPDSNLYRYFKYFTDRGQWTNWKDWFSGNNYTSKIYFCSKAQKVNIDRTIPMEGLKKEQI